MARTEDLRDISHGGSYTKQLAKKIKTSSVLWSRLAVCADRKRQAMMSKEETLAGSGYSSAQYRGG